MPSISLDPETALEDEALRFGLRGFSPGRRVAVTAEMTARDNSAWRSQATFVADADGAVDVSQATPVEGSYAGVSAMGLVWSMARIAEPPAGKAGRGVRLPVTIELAAAGEGGETARATATRTLVRPGGSYRPVDADGLKGGWHLPSGDASRPVVIVLGGSGGGAEHRRAALYAAHGYAAFALAYFGLPGLPRGLVNVPLEYFGTAIGHALATIRPANDFVAIDGISRGGELALLVGATFPAVRAVIGVMAGGLVMGPSAIRSRATTGRGPHGPWAAGRCRICSPSIRARTGRCSTPSR